MRWDRSNRHIGKWWKKWAWRPHLCVACDHLIWWEAMYKNSEKVFGEWKCPSCITLEKLRIAEEQQDVLSKYAKQLAGLIPPSSYPPLVMGGGPANVGQAPANTGVAPNTIQKAHQQYGPPPASNWIVPQACSAAASGASKVRKAAK